MVAITSATDGLRRSHVEVTDPDEVGPYLESVYGVRLRLSQTLQHRRDGGALLTHTRTDAGSFTIDQIRIAGEVKAAPDPMGRVMTLWTSSGHIATDCAGMTARAAAGDIALTSQHDLPYATHAEDIAVTSVLLDPSLVAGVGTGLPADRAPLPIRFSDLAPVSPAATQVFKDTVSFVQKTVLADDAVATPLVLGHASRLLAAVTLAAFPNTVETYCRDRDGVDGRPALLRRVIDFMDANATRDIALSDIAGAVHVSPRAVQYMFRRHLETTPLQYLRRLRLHYAHQDLLSSHHLEETVTNIAARWGFAHTGRFAVMYRETFGESPHQTLRR